MSSTAKRRDFLPVDGEALLAESTIDYFITIWLWWWSCRIIIPLAFKKKEESWWRGSFSTAECVTYQLIFELHIDVLRHKASRREKAITIWYFILSILNTLSYIIWFREISEITNKIFKDLLSTRNSSQIVKNLVIVNVKLTLIGLDKSYFKSCDILYLFLFCSE